jgi:hypothetical protein
VEDLRREPRRSGASVAGGSLIREVPGRAGAAATKPGRSSTARWIGSGERDAEVYERNRRLRPVMSHRLEPGGSGPVAVRTQPFITGGELPGGFVIACPGGHGECLRRNRGDAAGTESGASCDERSAVNTGTVPVLPPHRAASAAGGWVHRRPIGFGTGRSRRSTPSRGKPAHMGKGGSGNEE